MTVALTPDLLAAAMGCTPERAQRWAPALAEACGACAIDTQLRLGAFVPQIGHESGALQFVRELWGPTPQQLRYERDPAMPWPADAVQARLSAYERNRLAWSLGNTEPGDGRRYSGRGPIQITGRANYRRLTQRLRARLGPDVPDFEADPAALEQVRWGAHAAADYWDDRKLNPLADIGTDAAFAQITRAINGAMNGHDDRVKRWEKAKAVFMLAGTAAPAPAPLQAAAAPIAPPLAVQAPADPAPAAADTEPAPTPPPTQKEAPMLPALLFGLADSLIRAMAPLATEKLTREIGRHTDKPEVAQQISTAIIETAKAVTGKDDPIDAVAAVKADPAALQQVQQSALDTLDRMAPLLDKMVQWDQSTWAAEEASRSAARQHNDAEQLLVDLPWLKLKFIHVLSLVFVSFSGWFVTTNWKDLTPELRGAVITLMIIAGWNGVRDYWMGSSRSSSAKDAVIGELSRRK